MELAAILPALFEWIKSLPPEYQIVVVIALTIAGTYLAAHPKSKAKAAKRVAALVSAKKKQSAAKVEVAKAEKAVKDDAASKPPDPPKEKA